jgi:hypothetical protein
MPVKIDAISEPITYAKIVKDYVQRCRPSLEKEFKWFSQKQTFRKSLILIASAQIPDDCVSTRKADHQRRLKNADLKKAEAFLLDVEKDLRKARSFPEIHRAVKSALFFGKGLGELYAYDTAIRIAALKSPESLPTEVHLIAGARDGAKAIFGSTSAVMPVEAFPKPMRALKAYEIHNLLCSYRHHLARVR